MRARSVRACVVAIALAGACGDDGEPTHATTAMPSTTSADDGTSAALDDDTSTATAANATSSADAPASTSDATATTSADESSTGEPLPDFDDIPWSTGDDIGFGIAYKDTLDPAAKSVFIGYAGYPFPLDAAQSWVAELYHARLRELGVRHVYAVQGPADVPYSQLEIGNSSIAEKLPTQLGTGGFVLVAAHSSGTYVAHELFGQLVGGFDPDGVTVDQVVYFNLDGGLAGIDDAILGHLRRTYFVSAFDGSTGSAAANLDAMQYAGDMWQSAGGYVEVDASASGCNAGAAWCLHMTVINARPHDPADSSVVDYYDFVDRPVVTAYIDAKIDDARL